MLEGFTTDSTLWMRIMYGIAVVGAGAVGLMMLFAPRLAAQYVFAGSTTVSPYLQILGALWIALGTAALLGLFAPERFSTILLVQLIYKVAWLVVVALPALAAGNREPGLLFFTALFALWVVGLLFAVPFGYLFNFS